MDNKYPNSPDLLAAYFWLPKIERVYGDELGENEQDELSKEIAALEPGCSCVTDIELGTGNKLWEEDLHHLLKAPRELKKFKYRIGNTW